MTVKIEIKNNDACQTHWVMQVDAASVEQIVEWYGAFYAGDDYTVTLDGVLQTLDHNGEIVKC